MNFRSATLLAALLAALGLVSRVQAQTATPVSLLENAHATLAQADHDYNGHRVLAMREIPPAVHELTGTFNGKVRAHVHLRHTGKIIGKGREAQNTSDAQMRVAENMLQQASAGLSGHAFQHVNSALAQLNTALSIR
jgi:hypothetical protein